MAQVVIIGAGIAGLGAAIGLADDGHLVTVIERDPPPDTSDGDEAFRDWDRRSVPQFRQAHGFSARSRNLLLKYAPDVVDRLRDDGIEEFNAFKAIAPPEMHTPEDEAFTGVLSRRPAFELALRRGAESRPHIRFWCPAVATGLSVTAARTATRVDGVRLEGGARVPADVVFDAAGRRSPVAKWLAELGVETRDDVQDCGITYHTRYYRQNPDSGLSLAMLFAVRSEIEGLQVLGFPGDHRTYGLTLAVAPWDTEFHALRHNWAFDAVVNAMPSAAVWADPSMGTPLHDVATMAGHQNVRRRVVADPNRHLTGLLSIGDALCTTNPAYGWGASMALTYAFAAVESMRKAGGDLVTLGSVYDEAVRAEADGVYRESAAMDRARGYRWRNEPVPEDDAGEAERQSLIVDGVLRGALRDPVLGRAFLRRTNLLDAPDAILDDPVVASRAAEMRAHYASRPPRKVGPDRRELLEAIERARPVAG
jgi:2-polyprenyl-6-methoxyphenol hydroxylase-like FAD-dependent oxidoreductase